MGLSSSAKLWSSEKTRIPELLEWCGQLARKIASERDPRTQSGLDLLSTGEDLSRIPEQVAFADWHEDVFQQPVTVSMLAKYWAATRVNLKLHSFHAEMLIASSGIAIGPKSYGQVMYGFFKELSRRNGHGIRDPFGISGVIPASNGRSGAERLAAAAGTAADHSARALDAEETRNTPEAVRQWKIVFGGSFPS